MPYGEGKDRDLPGNQNPHWSVDPATGLLTTGAALGSAALQRSWAKKDLAAQNFYNSPAEQVKRLREAGLPLASLFSGGGGSQSDQPRSTQVDPTLGVSEGMNRYFMNQYQKRQLAIMDADIREKNAGADLKDMESKYMGAFAAGTAGPTNFEEQMRNRQSILASEEIIKSNQQLISNIEAEVESNLRANGFKQLESRLAEIVGKNLHNSALSQDIDITAAIRKFQKEVVEALDKQKGIRGIIGKIIYGFMYGQQRLPSIPGQ